MIKAIFRRFFGLVVSAAIPSVAVGILNIQGIMGTRMSVFICMVIGIVLFFVYNLLVQKGHFMDGLGSMPYYYVTLISYMAFALVTVATYKINRNVYNWAFSITKVLSVWGPMLKVKYAILAFHVSGFLIMCLAWIGLRKEAKEVRAELKKEYLKELEEKKLEEAEKGEVEEVWEEWDELKRWNDDEDEDEKEKGEVEEVWEEWDELKRWNDDKDEDEKEKGEVEEVWEEWDELKRWNDDEDEDEKETEEGLNKK